MRSVSRAPGRPSSSAPPPWNARPAMSTRGRTRGLSLIEVIVFIVVLGVAFAGMLILYNQVTRSSVDPLVRKQALAIAEALLEEIELMPFTYCDPDDANVTSAGSASVG